MDITKLQAEAERNRTERQKHWQQTRAKWAKLEGEARELWAGRAGSKAMNASTTPHVGQDKPMTPERRKELLRLAGVRQ